MIAMKRLRDLGEKERCALFNRFGDDFSSVMMNTVVPIAGDVRKNGDAAVKKYTEKFDGIRLSSVIVSKEEIDDAFRTTPADILDAFRKAKDNIEEFHARQKREDIRYTRQDGTSLGVLYQPIERVALYVPGGKASYPSTVLMGAIPAIIAGSREITVVTPPDKTGNVPGVILAVCEMLGISRVVKSGGAQGIAAAGFGTESVVKSDIIVGPGNIYVTAAKAYLFSLGVVQIDSMAGPSEVLIIADESASPHWAAWDLLSQAEHEEMAAALLVTTSEKLALRVREEIVRDIESGAGRSAIKRKSITERGLILIAEDLDEAIGFSNSYAPEHMEFMVKNPMEYLPRIKNVGSLFLGIHSPVAAGDYFSGTNHILPTGGAARFSSGVSVDTFIRRTTYQNLSKEALLRARGPINIMARVEGFEDKHGGSVEIRFEKK